FGVVMWVVGCEQRNPLAVDGTEARRSVGDTLANDGRDDAREDSDPDSARRGGTVCSLRPGEARPDDEVGRPGEERLEDLRQLRRVVLPVAVDLGGDVVAALERVAV